MFTHIEEDGTIVKEHGLIKGIPTFRDWLGFLLSRCAAVMADAVDRSGKPIYDAETGRRKKDIVPLSTRDHEQASTLIEDGTVKVICLSCGVPWSRLGMSKITVGGIIQLPDKEQTASGLTIHDPVTFTVKRKIQPTTRSGLGCPACVDRFLTLTSQCARENQARQSASKIDSEIAYLRSQLEHLQCKSTEPLNMTRCLHGMVTAYCARCSKRLPSVTRTVKTATNRTPFINVLEGDMQ